jgi:hypothetical protein
LNGTEQPSDGNATGNVRHFEAELHTPGNTKWRPDSETVFVLGPVGWIAFSNLDSKPDTAT